MTSALSRDREGAVVGIADRYPVAPAHSRSRLRALPLMLVALGCNTFDPSDFNGRWVMDAEDGGALWMEISDAGTADLSGKIVGAIGGRTEPFVNPEIIDGELRFVAERTFEIDRFVQAFTRVRLTGDGIAGETTIDGETRPWKGRRGALIPDEAAAPPGEPVALFSDVDTPGWSVVDGVLHNSETAGLLISEQKFWNFRLHAEYRVPQAGNSGIGLRGRYEVQILGDHGKPASIHGNGSLYSHIKPTVNATLPPEEWQTFDITLVGARVTIVLNGQTIIDNGKIPGLTAIALDSNETAPGPIVLQGDHGPVEFKNLVITPL